MVDSGDEWCNVSLDRDCTERAKWHLDYILKVKLFGKISNLVQDCSDFWVLFFRFFAECIEKSNMLGCWLSVRVEKN